MRQKVCLFVCGSSKLFELILTRKEAVWECKKTSNVKRKSAIWLLLEALAACFLDYFLSLPSTVRSSQIKSQKTVQKPALALTLPFLASRASRASSTLLGCSSPSVRVYLLQPGLCASSNLNWHSSASGGVGACKFVQ